MSQENVELVRRSWTADAFTALFDEHIVGLDVKRAEVRPRPCAGQIGRTSAVRDKGERDRDAQSPPKASAAAATISA
jgi:hypothetical protein